MPPRHLGLPAVLLAAAMSAGCATTQAADRTISVRAMSYNIQYGGGGQNLDSIIAVIRAAGADLVGLQEVDVNWSPRSGFADQAATIGKALGMEVRFAPIYDLPDSATGRRRQFGVALLSRHPIAGFTNHPITRLSTQERTPAPRPAPGFLKATVVVAGTPIRVFDTHLDYRADPAVRRQQVADMLAVIGTGGDTATVLFGDLNAQPQAPELQPLFARLRDAWPAAAGGGFTIPADAPARRIDFVLISSGITVRDVRVPATAASDHRPVVVDLAIPRARR